MKRIVLALAICALLYAAPSANAEVRIGVGALGPISPDAEYRIEQIVGGLPNIHVVPIVPPGDLDACVKRFVAGEPGDKLDGVIVVGLPADSFQTTHDSNE